MVVRFNIQSVCECQALLEAELDENYLVTAGWARRAGAPRESAPANSVGAQADRFDVVWQCPMCGRNTLRVFYRGALKPIASEPPADASLNP